MPYQAMMAVEIMDPHTDYAIYTQTTITNENTQTTNKKVQADHNQTSIHDNQTSRETQENDSTSHESKQEMRQEDLAKELTIRQCSEIWDLGFRAIVKYIH